MPVFMMMVIALACIAGVLYVAGSAAVNAVSYAAAEVRKHAGVFIVLLFGSAVASADVTGDSAGTIAALLDLISNLDGAITWLDWVIVAVVALHFLAIIYINVTNTPDNKTLYGKIYRYLVEPLAGILIKAKAKQKPFSDIRLK